MAQVNQPYVWGTGRRKTSVARVRIKAGTGNFIINGKPMKDYLPVLNMQISAMSPLTATETKERYDIWVNVKGGGKTGQADSVKLGLARALLKDNPGLEAALRSAGCLTRDSRMVERKKYGLHKARKATQYSKR
ncbi:MAG TPA: 30S ribosomal protein S9 [Planctomycetes bacterium]|nr:30S ribosomal protein S9 [Planctomycetota bacterium]